MNEDIFSEPFMSSKQKEFFKEKLLKWKEKILNDQVQVTESVKESDPFDLASNETSIAIEFKTRDRENKLINKIDEALKRIEDGSYGYCEETGEPIAIERLIARPIAILSIEAQEKREKEEKLRYRRSSIRSAISGSSIKSDDY